MTDADRISRRKLDHLELSLDERVEASSGLGWEDVRLVHDCLPEIDLADVDLHTPFLGYTLAAPLWITGMTGGHERAGAVNARLAAAAERYGLAMGLGSQRAALAAESLLPTYRIARESAPNAVLVANIGAPQLVRQGDTPPLSIDDIRRIVDSIEAQALAIHLNFLQESVQPEGERNARGCMEAIGEVILSLEVPVIVKETGAGISGERARDLKEMGAAAIDLGGHGGTSMVRVEGLRAQRAGGGGDIAAAFDDWGIPTPAAIVETRGLGLPIIATGGIRDGVQAAKALALGASAVGVGRPFLVAADAGEEALNQAIGAFLEELRIALFLTGSLDPSALRRRGAVLLGDLRAWAEQRSSS